MDCRRVRSIHEFEHKVLTKVELSVLCVLDIR